MGSAVLMGGMWFRASRYEIRDGLIRPSADATIELYDPWAAHVPAPRRRRHGDERKVDRGADERPYQALLRLAVTLRDAETGVSDVRLSATQEAQVLEWCRSNGLLGILPHQVEMVLFPTATTSGRDDAPRERANDDDGSLATTRGYRRAGLGWESVARDGSRQTRVPSPRSARRPPIRIPKMKLPEPVEPNNRTGGVVLRSLPDGRLERENLRGHWSMFFADKAAATRWPFPSFADEAFWRMYGEPVAWFTDVAGLLGNALTAIQRLRERRSETAADRQELVSSHDEINALAAPASPAIRVHGSSDTELRWATPSLLSSYGVMTQIDLAGGADVRLCDLCGAPYITTSSRRQFCGDTCRTTHNKRVQRDRKRRALALAGRGWTPARITAEVGAKDAATVERWINEARAGGQPPKDVEDATDAPRDES